MKDRELATDGRNLKAANQRAIPRHPHRRRYISFGPISSIVMLVSALTAPQAFAQGAAGGQIGPVVAVFRIQNDGSHLNARDLERLTDYLAAQLAATRRYAVVPKSAIKKALTREKRTSYEACFAEECQIEIGKELAAQQTLASKLTLFGSKCVFTLTFYDLRQATSVGGIAREGGCAIEDAKALVDSAIDGLVVGPSADGELGSNRPRTKETSLTTGELVAKVVLKGRCKGMPITSAKGGWLECVGRGVWFKSKVQLGRFSRADSEQAIVWIQGGGSHAEGNDHMELWERVSNEWVGLMYQLGDIEMPLQSFAAVPMSDGRDRLVVCTRDCWQGCCLGVCELGTVAGNNHEIAKKELFRFGSNSPANMIDVGVISVGDMDGDGLRDVTLSLTGEDRTAIDPKPKAIQRRHNVRLRSDGQTLTLESKIPPTFTIDGC